MNTRGLVMDKTIAELAKSLRDNLRDLGVCVNRLCDVVLQHEQRLQEIETVLKLKINE